jgi:S-adenosylmethionine-diacylglycerol 3-amino-3-carboxypropyl transferase
MEDFFGTLNYSASNEDGGSELRALRLTSADTVVCITGSGSRTLDLLTAGPSRVISVDMNPCQGHLLALKLAAIKCLDHADCLRFLGVLPHTRRQETYNDLRSLLNPPARSYWDARARQIEAGIIYQGRWERYFHMLATTLQQVRGCLLRRLMASTDIEEQRYLYIHKWDGAFWRTFMRSIAAAPVWRYIFRDPGFFRYVPANFDVADYLLGRFESALTQRLLRQSPFMTLLLRGRYYPEEQLPLYLMEQHYATLRQHADRAQIITAPIDVFLRTVHGGSIDAISLSDVGSYISDAQHADLWRCVHHAGHDGTRVCERQFLVKRPLTDTAEARIERDRALEATLALNDDAAFYTFIAGTLRGN